MGRYYEEFTRGDRFTTISRTVSPQDLWVFSNISGDFNPIHHDFDYMKMHKLGAPVAHGMLIASIATGLVSNLGLSRKTIVAMICHNITFKKPVYAGDTIYVNLEVIDKKDTDNPKQGIVEYSYCVKNQKGITVATGNIKNMMLKKQQAAEIET
jgi:acyl dehydratase